MPSQTVSVSARWTRTAWLGLLLVAGCGGAPTPSASSQSVTAGLAGQAIDLTVEIQPEHARDLDRYVRAAVATLKTYREWIGPLPYRSLRIVDPPWHGSSLPAPGTVTLDRTPWWNARASMAPELATVRGLSRSIWHDAAAGDRLPGWFVDGLAEYSARRIVEPLFARENNPPGYAFLEERYFGGFVPRFVRIRLRAEADGDPVPAYRAHPAVQLSPRPASIADARSLTAKTILALGTLERWLGRPVFDEAVAEFVRISRDGAPAIQDFERVASEVGGQDLSWFFDQAFRSPAVFDYGVERLASERQADGGFVTSVTARRYGEGMFSGRTAPRVGPFESGRGVILRVAFADGQPVTESWDGRDREKVFTYRGPAPAISAEIDPDGTILLDVRRTNNSVTLTPLRSTAAIRWAARYMNWVANALLRYAALV